jgi:hypothetical protein
MARMTKEQRFADVHANALAEFDRCQSTMRDERLQCLQDRRFYSISGAQWEGPLGEQFENKPRFEVNKIHLSVIRIINEYRNNRIAVDFISKDGSQNDKLANACNGLYRADERDSMAEEAYDNGFEEAVGGGYGAWRLRTVYEDDENDEDERQRIRIEPIYDADSSVFFDLDAKRQDKADAKYCFVLYSMTPEAYRAEWNDDPTTWPKLIQQLEFDWNTPDVVFVAEYYRVEEVRETIRIFQTIDGEEERYSQADFDADETLEETLLAFGTIEVRQKRIKKRRVHKYIMSGGGILEDCGYIAGKNIPIVPVYGKRWFVDNVERCMGHVRLAKDAQRLKNMQLSKLGEISALSSIEKPILVPEQVANHQIMWAEDNLRNYPYLLVNPVTGPNGESQVSGPVAYTRSPQIPPAMAALLQITEQDMSDILGSSQQADKMVSNISGKAVELIQTRLDMQAFIYMTNMAKSVRRCGEIWLSMAKDVYVEPKRKMKAIGAMEEVQSIELMRPTIDKETGEVVYENDLSNADFDVAVDVGPSFSSRREATVRALTGMMQVTTDPQTQQVLQAMAMMNIEGEGIDDVREYFRKQLVTLGVVEPTEEEQQAMQAASQQASEPTPEQQYLMTQSEKAMAEVNKINAEAQKIALEYSPEMIQMQQQAEAAKIAAEVERDQIKLETERLKAQVAEIQAMANIEVEREKSRAVIQAPQPAAPVQTQAPMILVDANGSIGDIVAPTLSAMTNFVSDATAAFDSIAGQQVALTESIKGIAEKLDKPSKSTVVIKKRPDGSYIGEKTEG